jgi:ATP-dependent DNA helicase RecG
MSNVRFDINHVIKDGENEMVEFKSSFNTEVIETLVAFANTKGGSVYVGINDSGKVTGVAIHKESIPSWRKRCNISSLISRLLTR